MNFADNCHFSTHIFPFFVSLIILVQFIFSFTKWIAPFLLPWRLFICLFCSSAVKINDNSFTVFWHNTFNFISELKNLTQLHSNCIIRVKFLRIVEYFFICSLNSIHPLEIGLPVVPSWYEVVFWSSFYRIPCFIWWGVKQCWHRESCGCVENRNFLCFYLQYRETTGHWQEGSLLQAKLPCDPGAPRCDLWLLPCSPAPLSSDTSHSPSYKDLPVN